MVKLFCDKCGKELTQSSRITSNIEIFEPNSSTTLKTNLPSKDFTLDFCASCEQEFIKYITTPINK